MAHIVRGEAHCNNPGCARSWPRDPVLEVICPDCRAGVGTGCKRPSGHSGPFVEFHAARDILADRQGHYGSCPFGRCGLGSQVMQTSLPLFD